MFNQSVELSEINAELKKIETEFNPTLKTETDVARIDTGAPVVQEGDDPKQLQTTCSQASLLEEDAKALLNDAEAKGSQAYEVAPILDQKRSW